MSLTPKNWKEFQHYKDRAPPWIKLHRTLLDNVDYYRLSPEAGKSLPLIWLLAAEKDGIIPDAPEVAFRLRIDEERASKILAELVERGFLVDAEHAEPAEQGATPSQRAAKSNGFGSRHISDAVKRAVWERDGGKCCECGGDENVEFDHKHPVSKGGTSDEGNIQLLCRPCNRRKRVRLATPALGSRSLEAEAEAEAQGKSEQKTDSRSIEADRPSRAPDPKQIDLEEAIAATVKRSPSRFDEFWKAYPRRDGPNPRKPAENKFNALVKSGVDPEMMIAAAKLLAQSESAKGNIGTRFIPQAMTWLNQQRWADHAAIAFLASEAGAGGMSIEDAVKQFARFGQWSRHAPINDISQAPAELLAKHGLAPDGRKLVALAVSA